MSNESASPKGHTAIILSLIGWACDVIMILHVVNVHLVWETIQCSGRFFQVLLYFNRYIIMGSFSQKKNNLRARKPGSYLLFGSRGYEKLALESNCWRNVREHPGKGQTDTQTDRQTIPLPYYTSIYNNFHFRYVWALLTPRSQMAQTRGIIIASGIYWLDACSVPSYYLNHWWITVKWANTKVWWKNRNDNNIKKISSAKWRPFRSGLNVLEFNHHKFAYICLYKISVQMHVSITIGAVITQSSTTHYSIHHCSDWIRIRITVWIHKRHPIPRPDGRDMGCLLLLYWKMTAL